MWSYKLNQKFEFLAGGELIGVVDVTGGRVVEAGVPGMH